MKGSSRYSRSRQKVCENCSTAKAKCDRGQGQCSRCAARGIRCTYPGSVATDANSTRSSEGPEEQNAINPDSPDRHRSARGHHETPDFARLRLCCPINVDDIQNRWLNLFVPMPGQQPKQYPAAITLFISRVLKSYVAVASRGRTVPPFIHLLQMRVLASVPPLSICLSLMRMCEQPAPGSEGVIVDLLRREMASIYANRSGYDHMAMLAAFQAFLLYAMSLFFTLAQGPDAGMREAMMHLQDLAAMSCRHGLVCPEEQQRARPKWEAWAVAEAKRRTLFTMYLFDSVLSSLDGLPTFLGTELAGLPAPASRVLWQAEERGAWESSYSLDLAGWSTGRLRIDELWPVSSDMGQAAVLERCNRVDRWLEDVDEYGTMLYAVTSCTHGT
ncbi:Zn(2)-C6 fungal-type DNA-binding domain protein [Metarhizium guizhouense ARSEF 977]|uniref:Zn(2)-C6 fungal-type DNA-binding domain protein n=1 Tax=Metarhizium guizhouense (strain ARSEF 977) TaxID=1276136 RepID=A0A0B4HYR9_METGA|nr:Zn(2)-C6 fungal-type DNA-binding domain protein [Metarhizium guizhouense ARSEF 977]